ncbi:MAG TPA: 30S ribosomal protein S18 [bacterium]|jgi:small subunit ribosomal protein S18|nr:30S ribosomal protein S18 [Dictyoglomota bacterium]HHV80140.1 30S ribosomal protein S18 [bacterium]HOK29663.1 30S ribosomal protein S18 [bacterium]HOL54940.1 30S ribosomal protein S18 [bacterium]HON72007.1 30S ribosomal protein S18 [bacterium]
MAQDRRREGTRRFRGHQRKKVCAFCTEKIVIDYKDIDRLRHFLSDRGKILPKRTTGTCARHQRKLARAIKRARIMALLPFTSD